MVYQTLRLGSGYPNLSPYLRNEVQTLQRALTRWGYTLTSDGEFGPKTDAAVRAFQLRKSLRDDGIVSSKTWDEVLSDRANTTVGSGFMYKPVRAPEPSPAAPPAIVNTSGGVSWMDIAKKEIGTHEVAGRAANPRLIEYHGATDLKAQSDEVSWCASFVNWALKKAGLTGTGSTAATSFARWGEACSGKYGAVCVIHDAGAANSSLSISGNHVGFLVEETSTHYVILSGNQSDSVKISQFPKKKWRVRAMRWPVSQTNNV